MKPFLLLGCACVMLLFGGCYSSVAVVDHPGYHRSGYRTGYYGRPTYYSSRPYYSRSRTYYRGSGYYGRGYYGTSYYGRGSYGNGGYYRTPARSATVVIR
jgi:hypothetical protein